VHKFWGRPSHFLHMAKCLVYSVHEVLIVIFHFLFAVWIDDVDIPTNVYGEHLKQQVENRLKFYETGETPAKNADVMKQAEAEVYFYSSYFVFIARDSIYAIARYMPSPVRLAVRPSHGWISQRRFKIGSRNLHHRVAP